MACKRLAGLHEAPTVVCNLLLCWRCPLRVERKPEPARWG